MKGKDGTIFTIKDKIESFRGKLKLWLVYLEKGPTKIFSKFELIGRKCYVHTINCRTLHKNFGEYFQTYGEESN
jgi:hypothetical protein